MIRVCDGFEEGVSFPLVMTIVATRFEPSAGDGPIGFKVRVGCHVGIELRSEAGKPD